MTGIIPARRMTCPLCHVEPLVHCVNRNQPTTLFPWGDHHERKIAAAAADEVLTRLAGDNPLLQALVNTFIESEQMARRDWVRSIQAITRSAS
jgi:hypothetical protein